jgi:nitrite reductase/ring-hydroxylating ferredoxin subunit
MTTMANDHVLPSELPDPVRRSLLVAGSLSIGAATAGFLIATFRFLVPNVLYEPSRRFDVGVPADFPPGSATFLADQRLFVFNQADGLYVISSVCTHLGCNVKRGLSGFACPCHGSQFDDNGRVVQGPAPKPLQWYSLSLSPRGRLVVNLDQPVTPEFRVRA